MKILLAVDGSKYTKRMLAYVAAHDEWLGPGHEYTVFNGVLFVFGRGTDGTVKYWFAAGGPWSPTQSFGSGLP